MSKQEKGWDPVLGRYLPIVDRTRRDEYGRAVLAKHVPETDGMCEGSLFGDLDGNPFATDETTEVMEGRRVRQ